MAMKSRNEFDDLIRRKIDKARSTGNTSASRTLRTEIAAELMNTDGDFNVYGESKGETVVNSVNPGKNFRDRIARKAAKALHLDAQTQAELATNMDFDVRDAAAVLDVAEIAGAIYNTSGKSTNIPCLSEEDGRMSYRVVSKSASSTDTNRLDKKEDGTYVSVPTGFTRKVKRHNTLKVSNRPWSHQVDNVPKK